MSSPTSFLKPLKDDPVVTCLNLVEVIPKKSQKKTAMFTNEYDMSICLPNTSIVHKSETNKAIRGDVDNSKESFAQLVTTTEFSKDVFKDFTKATNRTCQRVKNEAHAEDRLDGTHVHRNHQTIPRRLLKRKKRIKISFKRLLATK